MLDSRFLSPYPRLQGLGSSFYQNHVIIMRKKYLDGTALHSGDMGSTPYTWCPVSRKYPGNITIASQGQLEFLATGESTKGDYVFTGPYRRQRDGGLMVRERDVIINIKTRLQYLVLWSRDPMDAGINIMAGLEEGTTKIDFNNPNPDMGQG